MSVLTNDSLSQLNMIAFGFLLVTVLFSLQVHGHMGHTNQPAKNHHEIMKQIKHNTNVLDVEMKQLKNNKNQLTANIAQYKAQCSAELKTITDKHIEAKSKGGEAISKMYDLLKALQEEEKVQIKLTHELEILSNVLELFQIQYIVLDGNLTLINERKLNGSLDRCIEISTAIKNELLKTRAFAVNPFNFIKTMTPEDLARMTAEGQLKGKSASHKKLSTELSLLKNEVEHEKKICLDSKDNQNLVLQEAMKFQETSLNSKTLIEKLLRDAVEHSKAIRLELATGRAFVKKMTEKVRQERNAIMKRKTESVCYGYIENSE